MVSLDEIAKQGQKKRERGGGRTNRHLLLTVLSSSPSRFSPFSLASIPVVFFLFFVSSCSSLSSSVIHRAEPIKGSPKQDDDTTTAVLKSVQMFFSWLRAFLSFPFFFFFFFFFFLFFLDQRTKIEHEIHLLVPKTN